MYRKGTGGLFLSSNNSNESRESNIERSLLAARASSLAAFILFFPTRPQPTKNSTESLLKKNHHFYRRRLSRTDPTSKIFIDLVFNRTRNVLSTSIRWFPVQLQLVGFKCTYVHGRTGWQEAPLPPSAFTLSNPQSAISVIILERLTPL